MRNLTDATETVGLFRLPRQEGCGPRTLCPRPQALWNCDEAAGTPREPQKALIPPPATQGGMPLCTAAFSETHVSFSNRGAEAEKGNLTSGREI